MDGQLPVYGSQRLLRIVCLDRSQTLCSCAERFPRIKLLGFLEVVLRLLVLGQLYVQHATSDVKWRRLRLQLHSFRDYVDSHLEGLMRKRQVCEVQVQADI